MSALKYTCRLDFTTGKQLTEKGKVPPKDRKAVALANELEGTRRVHGISQVTLVGWLQSRLKMRDESPSPTIYIPGR